MNAPLRPSRVGGWITPAGVALAAVVALGGCGPRAPVCGDGVCVMAYEPANCPQDCTTVCGDGVCEAGETLVSCSMDCGGVGVCGNTVCEMGETAANCPSDCGGGFVCGNGTCEGGENQTTCPADCTPGAVCGNAVCETGESAGTCPADCGGVVCGNGTCQPGENASNCPADCPGGPVCGNFICESPETVATCPSDCGSGTACGNGIVEVGEQCDPPNGTTCDAACQNITSGPATPGGACTSDSACSSGSSGLPVTCVTESTFGWPGGYCLINGCTIDALTGSDDCPGVSHCEGFGDGAGGVVNYCLPDCTPSSTGIGGCRTTTTTTRAYTCLPSVIDPTSGGCWLGCQTDTGCNECDDAAGTCFGDPTEICLSDADCLALPAALACNTTINLCYPDHTAGASAIGDPCSDDLDCPTHALCATGAPIYPGGLCTQFYCDTYASLAAFACPVGAVCPATSGWFGGMFQACTASCTTVAGMVNDECDADRGDSLDYECFEAANDGMVMTVGELFDTGGLPGFCFQCEAFFTGCP